MIYLTRKAEFSAAHYYHNPDVVSRGESARLRQAAPISTATATTTPWKSPSPVKSMPSPALSSTSNCSRTSSAARFLTTSTTAISTRKSPNSPPSFPPPKTSPSPSGTPSVAPPSRQAASRPPLRAARSFCGLLRRVAMKVYLTRRYLFVASHRLHNPALGDAANRETYGKCNQSSRTWP